MMTFLLKGIFRDRGRSLFPFVVVATGVFLSVALYCYIQGVMVDVVRSNANLRDGHVKVLTRAYAKEADQVPNDAALTGAGALIADLARTNPDFLWVPRIEFGGLIDIPDARGETRTQAPVAGFGADLLTAGSPETGLLNLANILTAGHLPARAGEMLVSADLAERLQVKPGDAATLIGTTMHGAMSMANFAIAGTVRFGIPALDRMGLIADIADVRKALDMEDAAGQVLGLARDGLYRPERDAAVAAAFARRSGEAPDDFQPVMQTLRDQPGMAMMFDRMRDVINIILGVFLLAMSLIMWNAGLVGTLRRYGEFGVRLALGEDKGHVYRSMIAESLMIALLGSVAGTVIGLALSYYLQAVGINLAGILKNVSFLMPTVIRTRVTAPAYVVGFIPGLLATLIGTGIAGRGIYRRQTAQLFKELET